ncbi:MAG: thioredoxin family protein [Candidatus Lokiarchaeota archaeon]|nr:thioredoxin family protein [Candidatus Lokiarchaeota archaeon]
MTLSKVLEYPEGIDQVAFNASVSDGKVLIDVYTDWCGPCKRVKPIFKELSQEFPDVKFLSLDLDNARWIGERFEIHAIPTFLFFKDGQMIYKHLGAMGKDGFIRLIEAKF